MDLDINRAAYNSDPLLHLNEKAQVLEKPREFVTISFTTETGKRKKKNSETGQILATELSYFRHPRNLRKDTLGCASPDH